ncbi:hypothetical protein NRI_0600 [Neorickettsia risticii str. Illinois]|uniref:Uncharacterized protein n=1 Tax=Neorickettsia risticii (strain Illinois) TaxID=434131 RepID=C6V5B0_NEORI|nr:hypothetical protein NRI_0600 [Neorickettsia risticii str. Illinois]
MLYPTELRDPSLKYKGNLHFVKLGREALQLLFLLHNLFR